MHDIPKWRRYLRFWRRDPERDVDDELRTHVELRVAELVGRGAAPHDAERDALEEFGDLEATRARLYDIGRRRARRYDRFAWVDAARSDLRYALRGLMRAPVLSVTVILTLALGLGAGGAMYGVMRQLVLQPPPHVAAPERMLRLFFTWQNPGQDATPSSIGPYSFLEAARRDTSWYTLAAYVPNREVPIGRGVDARLARATMVSEGFWRTLGVRPALGRFIADDEAHPATGARVVVLGHAFWRRQFGGAREILGREIALRGIPYTIIGVSPRGFRGMEIEQTDLWLPLRALNDDGAAPAARSLSTSVGLMMVARLRDGVSRASAEGSASALFSALRNRESERIYASRPADRPRWGVRTTGVTGALDGRMARIPEARVSVWLVGVAAILLAVACTNVSGLLLLRALRRRREIAVRRALGMSRRRLAALLFTEGLVLAILGGLAAAVVTVLAGQWIRAVLIGGIATEAAGTDWGVVLAATACTLGAAMMAGLAPLIQLRGDATSELRAGGYHGSTRRSALFRGLLTTQTALSVVLLIGAGLFVRSIQRIDALDHGMDVHNVLAVEADFTGTARSRLERAEFFERALERMRSLPGVSHASLAQGIPLRDANGAVFRVAGSDRVIEPGGRGPRVNDVADDFFAATGMRIVQGRDFAAADRTGLSSIVASESLARYVWPTRSPIGECIYLTATPNQCTVVVGVVADPRTFTIREEPRPWFYRVLRARGDSSTRVLLIRTAPGTSVETAVRRALSDLDPSLPYFHIRRLDDALDPQVRPWRLGATLFTAFGVLAAVLAAIGLYAAVAYAVTQRTREIGIRVAVGASATQVVGLVLGDGARTAAAGVVTGLVIGLISAPLIADLLFDVSPRDPLVVGAVAIGAMATAVLASVAPARRALSVNPAVALRVD